MVRLQGSLLAALLCAAIFLTGDRDAAAQTLAPYEISAILSLSGPIAFGGKEQQQTLQIIEGVVNKTGGIQGHPLKITYLDDQSNPQVAVQLTSGLIAKGVPVFLGPIFTASCAAAAPLVEKSGPTMYCLTPGYQPTRGGYVFSPGGSSADQSETYLRFFVAQKWSKLAVLSTTDATGQAFVRGLEFHLSQPEFRSIKLVAMESMQFTDISVGAQVQRIKAAQPDVIFFTGSGPPYGTVLRGLSDAGIDLPVASSTANMTYGSMQQYKDILPKNALFEGSRGLSMEVTPKGPILDAQRLYFSSYAAAGMRSDGVNLTVWDPTWILVGGLRKLGVNATATQMRDYILNLHGWVGVNGVYDFASGDQRGIEASALVVYKWDPARADFIPISGPGGRALRK
jgi:branched-chain amino acid transport system substrate-binding protein